MATPTQKESGNSLDLVDIRDIRDNAIIMKDGSLRQIVMVGGVNFSLKSEAEQNMMTQAYQNFLNGIDFSLQIVVHSRKVNITAYLDTLMKRKETEPTPLLQSQISEYVDFIKGFVEKNAIMEKSFLVVVPFYPMGVAALTAAPKAAAGSILEFLPSFLGGGNKKKDAAEEAKSTEDMERAFKEAMAQLGQRTTQIVTGIENIGLEATVLENEELVELFYNFYNPQTVEREKINLEKAPDRVDIIVDIKKQ
jgi:type IV secretory pathway VirB4 component